jgi:dihydroxy-acid dehydratase
MIGKKRSLQGPEMSRGRAVMKAMGHTDEELARPRIGVANTWGETSPGRYHLKSLAEAVKAGIRQAGGSPFEFSTFAMCALEASDPGIRYDLPTRDVIAADVESCTEMHLFDGLVLISSCDTNAPAHLIAAARLDIPSIVLLGATRAPHPAGLPDRVPPPGAPRRAGGGHQPEALGRKRHDARDS